MAKIRKDGKHPVSEGGLTEYDPVPIRRAEVGPSQSTDGKPSQVPSGSVGTNTPERAADPRKPALTTESPLPPDATESSDANSTDGNTPTKKAQPSAKKTAPKAAIKKAGSRSTVEDDF